jgi:hypothetical protein
MNGFCGLRRNSALSRHATKEKSSLQLLTAVVSSITRVAVI